MPFLLGDDLDLDNYRGLNFADPAMPAEAANKRYVDSIASNISWRPPVRVATRTNVNLASPPAAIDGVTLVDDDDVLLMGQTAGEENGPYTFSGGNLVRNGAVKPGWVIGVEEGGQFADQYFAMASDDPFTLGVSVQSWTSFNSGAVPSYMAGDGIDITNFRVAAKPSTNGGIAVTSGGIGVVVDTDTGLAVGATGIKITPKADGGVAVDATGVRAKIDPVGALYAAAAGLGVTTKPNGGLTADATGLSAQLNPNGGLVSDALGLAVELHPGAGLDVWPDGIGAVLGYGLQFSASNEIEFAPPAGGAGLELANNSLSIVTDPAGGVAVGGSGLRANTGLGLASTTNDGLFVKVKPDAGVTVDQDGVAVKLKATGGLATDGTGLAVVPKPSGGIIVDATGVSVDPAIASPITRATIGNGTDTVFTIPHGFNSYDVDVTVYTSAAPREDVHPTVHRPDTGNVELRFGRPPTSGQYRVLIRR